MSTHLPQLVFECDQCGACCKHNIIEAVGLDVLREPRIRETAGGKDESWELHAAEACWILNDRNKKSCECRFLRADKACGIYSTRPNVCVAFQPGSEKCQDNRQREGLEPLKPKGSSAALAARISHAYREPEED